MNEVYHPRIEMLISVNSGSTSLSFATIHCHALPIIDKRSIRFRPTLDWATRGRGTLGFGRGAAGSLGFLPFGAFFAVEAGLPYAILIGDGGFLVS